MIEIVSPSRTLRLKGETAVEHRLWSDSLYKLCNPPPKSAAPVVQATAAVAEPRQEQSSRRVQRDTKQTDENEDEDRAQRKQRSERDRERERGHDRDRNRERRPVEDEERDRGSRSARSNRQRDDSDTEDNSRESRRRGNERSRDRDRSHGRSPRDDYDRGTPKQCSPSPKQRESTCRRENLESSRRSPQEREEGSPRNRAQESISSNHPSEYEHNGDDSSEDDRAESPRSSSNSSTRSLLVAQIKSGSSFTGDLTQCKNVISDSEEEGEENYHCEKKDGDPEEESPREPVTSSTNALDDDTSGDKPEQMSPERMPATQPSGKRVSSAYFDSDEEDNKQTMSPAKKNTITREDPKVPASSVTADNNFIHDDWDAEEDEPSSPAPTSKSPYPVRSHIPLYSCYSF
ncbi:unnamed protein product [Phytophthora fragariaefolia]|uniref:Unnamed protein product n=1 Tax=Phytophthora fragariaefolia TaxID=1490495 RepID=A0A9W6YBI1_9STRA|nr:unnamed protein product [Phytophthora fragariaefolia]